MLNKKIESNLLNTFESVFKIQPKKWSYIPKSGSDRVYMKIETNSNIFMTTYNKDIKENIAFVEFADTFKTHGLNVPEVYFFSPDKTFYFQQYLSEKNLFEYLTEYRDYNNNFDNHLKGIYKNVIDNLIQFQIIGRNHIEYANCYPRDKFDKQSMMWDLNYFKYYFLKLADVSFDEQKLEDDFNSIIKFLLSTDCNYFMYRDFQSRNIMIDKNLTISFIDFQGGRRGALQYDIASLLFDSKADIPSETREELLDYYIQKLSEIKDVDKDEFKQYFYSYTLIRILQAMGAYGFRGFYQRKEHFLKSVPYAINNLKFVLEKVDLSKHFKELFSALQGIINSEKLKDLNYIEEKKLTVEVNSFSYKRGVPYDISNNGGGYVFDCRAINNPGRYDEYKQLTGKDQAVIDFFKENSDIDKFLQMVYNTVDYSVKKYIDRGFTNLQVNFGCTGGRHRSVYCAEALTKYLQENYNVLIKLRHVEREIEK